MSLDAFRADQEATVDDELSAGPHLVRSGSTQYEEHAERARHIDVLQRAVLIRPKEF